MMIIQTYKINAKIIKINYKTIKTKYKISKKISPTIGNKNYNFSNKKTTT
jgi:hypothetical protein